MLVPFSAKIFNSKGNKNDPPELKTLNAELAQRRNPWNSGPLYADLILLLETAMGLALIGGAVLARQRRFRFHAWCQSTVILLNAAVIVILMLPSFVLHVSPRIPAKLGKPFYALSTAHAALGMVAEVGGLYLLLAAGTTILPQRFRLARYKLWMRTELVLWWLVLLLGMMTCARWYVPLAVR